MFVVELLLNLCWLALLLPAFLLWQRRNRSDRSMRRSLLFVCTLGCVLVLLFPIISASDDLHASGQAIEESKRNLRHGSHCICSLHPSADFSQPALAAPSAAQVVPEHAGMVSEIASHFPVTLVAVPWTGRAPPV